MKAVIYDKEWRQAGTPIWQLYYSDKADVTLRWNMYLQHFPTDNKLIYKHTVQTVLRKDKLEEHMITWQQSLNILSDPRGARWPPRSFSLFTKMAVAYLETKRPTRRLCSWLVALFTHHWSSSWTRFTDEAHLQYKNIVQQFSCHSEHSYLSFNGPVTSVAIWEKKTPKIHKNSATQSFPSTPVLCQYDLVDVKFLSDAKSNQLTK